MKRTYQRVGALLILVGAALTLRFLLLPKETPKTEPSGPQYIYDNPLFKAEQRRTASEDAAQRESLRKKKMPNEVTLGGDPVTFPMDGIGGTADPGVVLAIKRGSTVLASSTSMSGTGGGFTFSTDGSSTFTVEADSPAIAEDGLEIVFFGGANYFHSFFDVLAGAEPPPWPTTGGTIGNCTRLKAGDVINFSVEPYGLYLGSYSDPLESYPSVTWRLTVNGITYTPDTIPSEWDYTEVDDTHFQLTVPHGLQTSGSSSLTTYTPAPYPFGASANLVGCFYFYEEYTGVPPAPGVLRHSIVGGQHGIEATSPDTLPDGATKFVLRSRYSEGAGALQESSAVAVETAAFVANDSVFSFPVWWAALDDSDTTVWEGEITVVRLAFPSIDGQGGLIPGSPVYYGEGDLPTRPDPINGSNSYLAAQAAHFDVPSGSAGTTLHVLQQVDIYDDIGYDIGWLPARGYGNPATYLPTLVASGEQDFYFGYPIANYFAQGVIATAPIIKLALAATNGHGIVYSEAAEIGGHLSLLQPAPPTVAITGATTATVSAVDFDDTWDTLQFRYYRTAAPGTVLTAAMTDATAANLTGLITGQPYKGYFRAFDANGGYVDSPETVFTPQAIDEPPTGTAPTAPDELTALEIQDVFAIVDLPALPTNADSLKIVFDNGTDAAAVMVSGSTRKILNLTASTVYTFRARATNAFDTTDGPPLELKTRATPTGGGTAPNKPNAPFAQSKTATSVRIATSGWQSGVTAMKLYKNGSLVATLNNSTETYTDTAAVSGDSWTARAHNDSGDSVASDAFVLSLASSTLTLAWQTPAAGATLSNRQLLSFSATGNLTNPKIYIRGLLAGTPVFNADTSRYELTVDTADYASGSVELKATATGSDGLLASAVRTVTLDNSLAGGVRYQIIKWLSTPPAGKVWWQALLKFEKSALSASQRRWNWVLNAVTAELPTTQLVGGTATLAEKATAFNDLQRVTFQDGQAGTTPDRTQMYTLVRPAPPGQVVYWVQQYTPAQALRHFLTGCEQVSKLREIEDGLWLVFANSPTGTDAAKVFSFDGSALNELVDLGDYGATDATDTAILGDKIFVVAPDQLFAIDTDSGEAPLNLSPRGETRSPSFVETVGGKVLGIFVDSEAVTDATACYDLTFQTPKLLWEIDDAVTRAWSDGTTLLLAAGAKLYSATTSAATLLHTFGASLTAIADGYAGQSDGDLYRLQGSTWTRIIDGSASIQAVAEWEGSGDELLGVAGTDSANLLEEGTDGTWSDARAIEPGDAMTETITSLTALARYEKTLVEAQGEPGQPGYVAAETQVALLIGTGDDGVLSVLELSPLNESAGAYLYSGGNRPSILAFAAQETT